MANLGLQLAHDRAIRDTARTIVENDLKSLKSTVEPKVDTAQMKDRVRDAADLASQHKGKLGSLAAIGVIAIIAWLFRDSIAAMLQEFFSSDEPSTEPQPEEVETPLDRDSNPNGESDERPETR